jgi:hypothetical protein
MALRDEFDPEEVNKLPIRYQVAFAARCARRVRPLLGLGDQVTPADEATLERAIESAEFFAADRALLDLGDIAPALSGLCDRLQRRGGDYRKNAAARVVLSASYAIHAAEMARDVAHPVDVRLGEFAAAAGSMLEAIEIAEPDRAGAALAAARTDLNKLAELASTRPSPLGNPIDTAEDGPLGPLWPVPLATR